MSVPIVYASVSTTEARKNDQTFINEFTLAEQNIQILQGIH